MHDTQPLPTIEIEVERDGKPVRALVVAPHGTAPDREPFPFEIAGYFDPDGPAPRGAQNAFRQNGAFVRFLHWVIAREGPAVPAAQAAARALGSGVLRIVVGRAAQSGTGEPADEDVLGQFSVADGAIVAGSYRPALKHRLLTERGMFQLGPALRERVLERMAALVALELAKK